MCLLLLFISCSKEESFEIPGHDPNTGGPGGNDSWGWSFKSDTSIYSGCVDTAYLETIMGINTLSIDGTDDDGNTVKLTLVQPGEIKTGSYSLTSGAGVTVLLTAGQRVNYNHQHQRYTG